MKLQHYVFRCRRCQQNFRYGSLAAEHIAMKRVRLRSGAVGNDARTIDNLTIHECQDGGLGVGDLAGIEGDPE